MSGVAPRGATIVIAANDADGWGDDGIWRSTDTGATWDQISGGLGTGLPAGESYDLVGDPGDDTQLFTNAGGNGIYRSDDHGDHWVEITSNLPSDFGYAVVCDPEDPDTVYQAPVAGSHLRTAPGGRLSVFRTRDAGGSWESVSHGLPAEHVYVTVLREAMDVFPGQPASLCLGTSGGQVFTSPDGGESWSLARAYLPRVLSVRMLEIPA